MASKPRGVQHNLFSLWGFVVVLDGPAAVGGREEHERGFEAIRAVDQCDRLQFGGAQGLGFRVDVIFIGDRFWG